MPLGLKPWLRFWPGWPLCVWSSAGSRAEVTYHPHPHPLRDEASQDHQLFMVEFDIALLRGSNDHWAGIASHNGLAWSRRKVPQLNQRRPNLSILICFIPSGWVELLWSNDIIWCHGCWSALVEAKACRLATKTMYYQFYVTSLTPQMGKRVYSLIEVLFSLSNSIINKNSTGIILNHLLSYKSQSERVI